MQFVIAGAGEVGLGICKTLLRQGHNVVLIEKNEALVLDLLQELNRQGRTIVMVTHNPELGELTDRVIYLHHGKFVKEEIHEK